MSEETASRRIPPVMIVAVLYAGFILYRCYLFYEELRPVTRLTLLAHIVGAAVVILFCYPRRFLWQYAGRLIGIWSFEIAAGAFEMKPLLIGEGALALLFVAVVYFKEVRPIGPRR